jgi:predicted Zn finger-like uncharacterized protein
MRIVCPNCEISSDVSPGSLGERGRAVRCAKCRSRWFAETPMPEMAVASDRQDAFAEQWEPPADAGDTPAMFGTEIVEAAPIGLDDIARVPAISSGGPPLAPLSEGPVIEAEPVENRRQRAVGRHRDARGAAPVRRDGRAPPLEKGADARGNRWPCRRVGGAHRMARRGRALRAADRLAFMLASACR